MAMRRRHDDDDDTGIEQRRSVELSWFGLKGRVQGFRFIEFLLVLSCIVTPAAIGTAVILQIIEWRTSDEKRFDMWRINDEKMRAEFRARSFKEHEVIERNQREIIDTLEEMVYVGTLSAEERRALRIEMPPSLRKKTYGGR